MKIMDLDKIPILGKLVAKSLCSLGMESIIPRMGFEEINSSEIGSRDDKVILEIIPWTFIIVSSPSKPFSMIPDMEPGTYEIDICHIVENVEGEFPIIIRQIGLVLDGSREKFMQLTDGCMN